MTKSAAVKSIFVLLCVYMLSSEGVGLARKPNQIKSLAGTWAFRMDPDDVGQQQQWYAGALNDSVQLPGTMDQNEKGYVNNNHQFTSHLSRPFQYSGKAWYQRQIEIASDWADKHVTLHLERSKLTTVWLDDQLIGSNDSLGCEQVYDLTGKADPGRHVLTICVDNKTRPGVNGGHQITDHTQTNWNGIIGRIEIRMAPKVYIERALAYPNVQDKSVRVKVTVGNVDQEQVRGDLRFSVRCVTDSQQLSPESQSYSFVFTGKTRTFEYVYPLGDDALLWDEFTPNLYELTIALDTQMCHDSARIQFGLRQFGTDQTQFCINGSKTFLRGKHDAMVWPILGYPSMNVDDWVRILKTAKSYGINHYRFHSCTPPEAAFEAADKVGVYMQPELYNFGGNLSENETAAQYCRDEGRRILETYGSHPSFVMFTLGNEMGGGHQTRAAVIDGFREFDDTRLYAQASNYDFWNLRFQKGDNYWTTVRTRPGADAAVRGSYSHANLPLGHIQVNPPSTQYDFAGAIANTPVPVIGHETGQFQVFPNFDEIKKYTGVQKAWNFEVFADRLKKAGMYDQREDFFKASGALAVICYREDIEAAMRTQGFGGFQLLDLQDFPGQGTALVGILDAFMDSKGLITPQDWRQFCCEAVPLIRMEKYTWQSGELFRAKLQAANYSPADIRADVRLRLRDSTGQVILSKVLEKQMLKQGQVNDIDAVTWNLPDLNRAEKLTLSLEILGTAYRNDYPIWIYPRDNQPEPAESIHVQRMLDNDTMKLLGQGQKVLLIPEPEDLANSVEGFFANDFWCYPMFYNIAKRVGKKTAPGTLGILCDPKHPALAEFPTEFHSNWQWWHLVMNSRAMVLDATDAGYRPIVQVVDNFVRNHKLGLVFECRVGRGRLLVCTIDLPNLQDRPEARQLYKSLLDYMSSQAFAPESQFRPELIVELFKAEQKNSGADDAIDFSRFFNAQ